MVIRARYFLLFTIVLGFLWIASPVEAFGQRNDYLTEKEIELIRFNQELDKRMEVYVKSINRRFMSLTGTESLSPGEIKRIEKDAEKWGKLPKGSQTKLLFDIQKILDEAIDKIDDVATRDAKSGLLPKALHILANGARTFVPQCDWPPGCHKAGNENLHRPGEKNAAKGCSCSSKENSSARAYRSGWKRSRYP